MLCNSICVVSNFFFLVESSLPSVNVKCSFSSPNGEIGRVNANMFFEISSFFRPLTKNHTFFTLRFFFFRCSKWNSSKSITKVKIMSIYTHMCTRHNALQTVTETKNSLQIYIFISVRIFSS